MAVSTHSAPRGLGGFLAVLEQRLAALPVDDLRAILVAHAERLPVRDREAFLAIFPAPSATVSQVPGPCQVDCPDGTRLLADIDAFVDRVRSGVFFEGWGWDDDLHEERAWGDESWVGEMDDLFAVAAEAFLAGDLALARRSGRSAGRRARRTWWPPMSPRLSPATCGPFTRQPRCRSAPRSSTTGTPT